MKTLENSSVSRQARPVKMLQFGEGNFLRAFADWMIDIANERGVTDFNVAVVKPRKGTNQMIETLRKQDGLYNVVLEGVEAGQPKREVRLVSSVAEVFTPDDTAIFEKYIFSPDLRFVISNTTEAGIRYVEDDVKAAIPESFPGKVVNLLWRRYKHFNGDPSKGLFFICCELIEDNGSKLREIVLRHAAEAGLPEEFINWVKENCIFVDTLVDRIVAGKPENIDELKEEIGYDDNAIVKGELYHLWAIGGDGAVLLREELPLDKAGLHVLFMPSIKDFRDRKVRILNGSHTGMVAIGLLAGCDTVADAYNDPDIHAFLHGMMDKEVLPAIDGDRKELKEFSDGILERFLNPYIRHHLASIALNSLSKWEARNFDTAKDNWQKLGRMPEFEIFTFASLLALYAPESGFTPNDNAEHVALIQSAWNDADLEATVRKIVEPGQIFQADFEAAVPGFSAKTAEYVEDIRRNGIKNALKNFLKTH